MSPGPQGKAPARDRSTPQLQPVQVLQWNCRGYNRRSAELHLRLTRLGSPQVILLQENNTPTPTLSGYHAYVNPTITRVSHATGPPCTSSQPNVPGAQKPTEKRGQAAVLIDRNLPQTQLNTSVLCSPVREVVAVRVQVANRRVTFVSVYIKPGLRNGDDMQWTATLRQLAGADALLIGGDFNARHTAWGYPTDTRRGDAILQAMATIKLDLLNSPDSPTRIAQYARQSDTTPDLTWASTSLRGTWSTMPDSMGSDHLAMMVTLRSLTAQHDKVSIKFTKWDEYRTALISLDEAPDPSLEISLGQRLMRNIKSALSKATTTVQVKPGGPPPDLHLLNIWASRLRALQTYRKNGRTPDLRTRLNQATATARRYTLCLHRDNWHAHCASFNERTGLTKAWHTFRGMQGKRKVRTAAENIALHLHTSNLDLAIQAGDLFFPQSMIPQATTEYNNLNPSPSESDPIDQPFTMAELLAALQDSNARSTPGADGISYSALRNLPESQKETFLGWINVTWEVGELPKEWLESIVVPIPKPGKPSTQLCSLRPISLTSNSSKIMERMVLRRIQWHLDTTASLDPHQTGFRPHMSTHDSLLLIHNDVLAPTRTSGDPRILVAIDVKKAFDSIPHASVLEGARRRGLRGHTLRFITAFLSNRLFRVRVGPTLGPLTPNNIGVPQGSVLSPTLFNLAMAELPFQLRKIPDLGFTIYADDVSIWSKGGSLGHQEQTVQTGLDVISAYLEEAGLQPAPEKTSFIVVGNRRALKAIPPGYIQLSIAGHPIAQELTVRILGIPINSTGRAHTWLVQITKTWHQTLHLIRRVTSKSWGADEASLKTLVRALLVSKVLYGYNCFDLTKRERQKIETLHREALRVITGLPRFTPLHHLYEQASMNTIEDQAEANHAMHILRLEGTLAGRQILREVGYDLSNHPPLEHPAPPWEAPQLADAKPLPRNMGRHQKGRRRAAAAKHAEETHHTSPDGPLWYIYTDAATADDWIGLAWHCPNTDRDGAKLTYCKCSPREAELRAIHHAISEGTRHITMREPTSPTLHHIKVFTDSQEAVRACTSHRARSRTVRMIRTAARALQDLGFQITISWIPGHEGIPGNERVHQSARASLSHIPDQDSARHVAATTITTIPDIGELVIEYRDTNALWGTDYDHEEATILAKAERRAALRLLVPEEEYPLPTEYGRAATVLLRRIRTGAVVTPARRAFFNQKGIPINPGNCTMCNTSHKADCQHLLWECQALRANRDHHLGNLHPSHRPCHLRDWTHPTGTPQHRKAILDSLLAFIQHSNLLDFF